MFPEASLWTREAINNNSYTYNRANVKTDFTSERTVKSKTKGFKFGVSLGFDLLGKTIYICSTFANRALMVQLL